MLHRCNYYSILVCLAILRTIPMSEKQRSKLLPPYEIKGSGTPVSGIIFTILPRFTSVCIPKKAKILPANSRPNRSGAFSAIRKI